MVGSSILQRLNAGVGMRNIHQWVHLNCLWQLLLRITFKRKRALALMANKRAQLKHGQLFRGLKNNFSWRLIQVVSVLLLVTELQCWARNLSMTFTSPEMDEKWFQTFIFHIVSGTLSEAWLQAVCRPVWHETNEWENK